MSSEVAAAAMQTIPVAVHGVTVAGAGIWTVVALMVGLIGTLIKKWPEISAARNNVDIARVSEWRGEIAALRIEVDKARAETSTERHRCDEEMDRMRASYEEKFRTMQAQVDGLHRQIVQMSVSGIRLGAEPSDAIQDAAIRATAALDGRNDK